MAKLVKGNSWIASLKGKGVSVIDNTGTVPEVVSKPMPVRNKDRGKVENGKVKQTKTIPQPTPNGSVVLPAQSEVDAALERSKASHAEYVIEPSGEVPFADLAGMAVAPEIAEENAVVVEVEDKFSTPLSPMQWDDFVTEAQQQGVMPQDEVADFPTETPIVYVSLDVPEGVELVVKINGQELL